MICLLALGLRGPAYGALTIEITEGVEGALPIAVVPFSFAGAGVPPQDVAAIIRSDLHRSGRFAPIPEKDMLARPVLGGEVNFADWRMLGMESLLVGKVAAAGGGGYEVQFQLFDVFKGEQLAGYSISTTRDEMRATAHHISDIVYERLTGERGAFATQIAYVSALRGPPARYILQVADADGHNPQTILESKEPLMSPAWSPDGSRLAYVSFEEGRSAIYVQEVYTGKRERVGAYRGVNGAPAWSPDGSRLALTLSKDGNPEIYVFNLRTRGLTRITHSAGIDTEPAWSPDGATLVFTSDRGGRPQIYQVSAAGGQVKRLTFEGQYNARAAFSPDGKRLAMIHGTQGNYRIAVMDLRNGEFQVLTRSSLDESPSFAPNGSMIIYATNYNNRGILAAVSVDGRVRQRLALQEGDVREPAWSPFNR